MEKYISNLVLDKGLVKMVKDAFGNEDIHNPTYSELFYRFFIEEGFMPVIEPYYSKKTEYYSKDTDEYHSRPEGIYWTAKVYQMDPIKPFKVTKCGDYKSWEQAADSVLRDMSEKLVKKNEQIDKPKKSENKSKETPVEPVKKRMMDHPLYGRHSEEDPFPFE